MTTKESLIAALRSYIDNVISVADLEDLAVFADQVWLAGESIEGVDPARRQALIDAGRLAFVEVMGGEN
ncbi:hypothetical protein [Devosia sp. Leaf64]|uniref:hypothetical protein n=1 Tax=Devosia sp. Leaf64 TaxID=1736229 RepID=UPI0007134F4F|nr:hypothetical protein [Devosia sp. Leaf64]KQN75085.1 hypothetical protein ASE94_01840 [Devosia sp. Leaf64]